MDEMKLAALLLWSGDQQAYESHTEAWVKRYQDAKDPIVPDRVAKCYFAGKREENQELQALAADLARRTKSVNAPDWFRPWGALCRGISEYRIGKHADALKTLAAARSSDTACSAAAHAYAAMAAHKLGNSELARTELLLARTANEPIMEPGEGDLGSSWHDRIFALLALGEAEQLINGNGEQP